MRDITYADQQILLMVIRLVLTRVATKGKLVTKDRVHMSPGPASGEGGRVGHSWNCMYFFLESLLGGVNVGK